jgi:hypothetical protein
MTPDMTEQARKLEQKLSDAAVITHDSVGRRYVNLDVPTIAQALATTYEQAWEDCRERAVWLANNKDKEDAHTFSECQRRAKLVKAIRSLTPNNEPAGVK